MGTFPSFILFICVIVGLCGGMMLLFTLISRFTERDKRRRKQLEILEEALKRGDMNADIRREVVAMLRSDRGGFHWSHIPFGLGWLGLFAGGGLALLGNGPSAPTAGFTMLVASFAVITLPMAIREMTRRAPDSVSR